MDIEGRTAIAENRFYLRTQICQRLRERAGGTTEIWVETRAGDGTTRRSLLRETDAGAVLGATGSDPAGRGLFATWDESGERWAAHSRDGGASWSPGRRLEQELRLRDGAVRPGDPMPGPVADTPGLPSPAITADLRVASSVGPALPSQFCTNTHQVPAVGVKMSQNSVSSGEMLWQTCSDSSATPLPFRSRPT